MFTTVYQMLNYMEHNYSDRIAFQYYDERECEVKQISYKQYCEDVYGFAMYLRENVAQIKGCHIGILANNSYRYMVCLFGIMVGGGISVLINPNDTWENIHLKISHADVTRLIVDSDIYTMFDFEEYKNILVNINGNSQNRFLDSYQVFRNNNEPCIMIYTSGTTGRSKCAMFSEKNIFAPMQAFVNITIEKRELLSEQAGKMIVTQPLFHISGLTFVMTTNIMGQTMNMCNSIRYIYRDLSLMESNWSSVVPLLLKDFYKQIRNGNKKKLGGLRMLACGGAPVDSDMFKVFADAGIFVLHAYGLTEIFGGGTTNMSGRSDKIKSVGVPGVGCDMKIEDGEVCFKSDAVMLGYYKDEEATAEAIRDGWLHTGDLGYLDEDGFLYLTGRKKNLIILSNGENVSVEEIEGELLKNLDIWETVVREKNEKICAVIYCSIEKQEQIRKYISESNRGKPLWKRITEVEFRESPFKKTNTGKIIRSI